jgi:hypothetical protein
MFDPCIAHQNQQKASFVLAFLLPERIAALEGAKQV